MAHGQKARQKKGEGSLKNGPYKNKMMGSGPPKSSGMNQRVGKFSSKSN